MGYNYATETRKFLAFLWLRGKYGIWIILRIVDSAIP